MKITDGETDRYMHIHSIDCQFGNENVAPFLDTMTVAA